MDKMLHVNLADIPIQHRKEHEPYEFFRKIVIPMGASRQCTLAVYEIPPGKSAFPYHYHVKDEEVFYVISGTGTLRTPQGERPVSPGDFMFFPACENGAHKLTNTSDTENLVYIDFDTSNDLEVAFYPDSGKIGVWGKDINKLFRTKDDVEYYDGE